MTLNSPLRFFPFLVAVAAFFISKILSFNGLYGQDAHEYLRLSQAYFERLNGDLSAVASIGRSEMAGGYPLAGAVLRFLVADAAWALQLVSWTAAGLAVWLFERLLQLFHPGTSLKARVAYVGLALALAPYFMRAGLTVMADGLGLVFLLAALFCGVRVLEFGRGRQAVWAAVFAGLAVITRFTAAAFLLPFMAIVGLHLLRLRQGKWVLAAIVAGLAAVYPHFHFEVMAYSSQNVFAHATLREWSLASFFKHTFTNENGTLRYLLPNGLYVFSPLAHPGFCLPISILFLMAKKTDFHHVSQKVILVCSAFYLLFIGGLPCQNMRYLLPAYVVLALLLFPAWDRFFSYGFYFFKRLTWAIVGTALMVQIVCGVRIFSSAFSRNRLETAVATELRRDLPPGATLLTFDLAGAMRTYLPDCQIKNLWERRYDDFPPGSFILFNEPALRQQWQGQNPMLNWDFAKANYKLRELRALPQGWGLFEIGAAK